MTKKDESTTRGREAEKSMQPELLDGEPSQWHDLSEQEISQGSSYSILSGERIGPYRVLRTLGQGGMGVVFLAERADQQFEQRVAIKLVRRELLSKQVQSRLRVERQILASLEHPNIARLLDGGSTEAGVPYLVMEYVDGEPIDIYCDQHRLSINQRLELFRNVCDAVHSAHQNLIVHRDLKPSNILVSAAGIPKLLDFGIAKMLDARQFTQTVALTEADYRMLTPDHASPEQLTGDLITTSSDVYVLGVLLYELLTGCKPFRVQGRSFGELERAICEEPPLPPARIFSSPDCRSAPELEDIAASRSTTLSRLKRELEGDLSSIVLMALRKEPERRYGSARQFSEDIGRYLQGLPVSARLDTWAYRAARFTKRHAAAVGLAAGLAVTLISATIFTYLNSLEIERQRDVAQNQRELAFKQSQTAEAIADFLVNLFKAPAPEQARGNAPSILEYLDKAPEQIRNELTGQREVQAKLFNTIGEVYMRLGRHDLAKPLLEESWAILEKEKVETALAAEVALNLGEIHLREDDREAERFFNLSIAMSQRIEGGDSRGVARGQCGLGILYIQRNESAIAEQRLRQCLALYQRLPNVDVSESAIAWDNLASNLSASGKLAEAETIYRQWLAANSAMPEDSPRVLEQKQNLATVLQREGKLEEAIQLYGKVVEGARKVWPDSELLVDVLTNHGWALQELMQFEEADKKFKEAQSINAKLNSVTDVNRAYLMGRTAGLALDRGQLKEAESRYREALQLLSAAQTMRFKGAVLSGLSKTLVQSRQPKDAERYVREALPLLEKAPGKTGYLYGLAQAILGRALWQQNVHDEARALLREGYDKYVKQRGPKLPEARLLRSWLDEAQATPATP